MEEKDVKSFMKRDLFEQLAAPILERVKGPCQKALAESGLTLDQIATVELVGSGSRVPAIVKILTSFFGKEPRRTMNASECVSRGCALQCAMLSPTFKVREFEVRGGGQYGGGGEREGGRNKRKHTILQSAAMLQRSTRKQISKCRVPGFVHDNHTK